MAISGRIHDQKLLDILEALPSEPYSGTVWRTAWKNRNPLIGSSGGGRWDPPGFFEVLYTSTESNGSLAEVYYHLSQAPVFSSNEMLLYRLKVKVEKILRLTEAVLLKQLEIEAPLVSRLNTTKCQAISGAARFLEFQGLLVPSTRWDCLNLVLFLDRLDLNETISVGDQEVVNWPAWKEQHDKP